MSTFEAVLRDANALSPEDRERLIIHMHWSLEPVPGEIDEPVVIAELDRIARHADENPDSVIDWQAAREEIFGDTPRV